MLDRRPCPLGFACFPIAKLSGFGFEAADDETHVVEVGIALDLGSDFDNRPTNPGLRAERNHAKSPRILFHQNE